MNVVCKILIVKGLFGLLQNDSLRIPSSLSVTLDRQYRMYCRFCIDYIDGDSCVNGNALNAFHIIPHFERTDDFGQFLAAKNKILSLNSFHWYKVMTKEKRKLIIFSVNFITFCNLKDKLLKSFHLL